MNWLSRSWARLVGIPARTLARRLSSRFPRKTFDGIELLIAGREVEPQASQFFERTEAALEMAGARAPAAYSRLRKDVRTIALSTGMPGAAYNPVQLSVVVPVGTVLGRDALSYAAWLLYASGLSRSRQEGIRRAEELLLSVEWDEREAIKAWLLAGGSAE